MDEEWVQVQRKQPKRERLHAVAESSDDAIEQQTSMELQPSQSEPTDQPFFEAVRELVRGVLDEWTSYQLAVQDQLGGSRTSDKDKWLGDVLAQYLTDCDNKSMDSNELADWLDDILDEEFNLIVEDGSLEMVAEKLIKEVQNMR
uniref:Pre-rRNA-processing protein TSR2 homolog n=1 Tax=Ditylenchus dipsaci TaxID=166011 RepID=A0A915ECM8_9BILA